MIKQTEEEFRLAILNEIDSACDRFESDWKRGKQPTAEAFLLTCADALRSELLPYLREIEEEYQLRLLDSVTSQGNLARNETKIDSGSSFPALDAADRQDDTRAGQDFELPVTFDRFELQERIGSGGTSTVFRAYDPKHDRIVAIKVCHNFVLANRTAQQRFLRELASTSKLESRHIIRVLEHGQSQGRPFLVMEYLPKGTLADALQTRKATFDFPTIVRWISQIAKALQTAHAAGVIHRDVKPSNILLFEDATCDAIDDLSVKLVDFGLALTGESLTQMTRTGEVLGTLGYLSPEVISEGARQADARSDIYSLGVLFYELLTGHLPFRKPMPALLQQILLNQPLPPRWTNASIPAELELICLKCLEKAPAARFQSATELLQELERWCAGQSIKTRPDSSLVSFRKLLQRNKAPSLAISTLGVLLLTVAVGLVFFQWQQIQSRRAIGSGIVDAYLKAEGDNLGPASQKVLQSSAALFEVEQRLSLENLSLDDEVRLRALRPKKSGFDNERIIQFLMMHADATEFAFLVDRLTPEAVAKATGSNPGVTDPVDFEFRRALMGVLRDPNQSPSDSRDQFLADGLCHLQTADRMKPWLDLCRPYTEEICRLLRDRLLTANSEEERFATAFALTTFYQGEPKSLAALLVHLEGKQLQMVCEAIGRLPEEDKSIAVSEILAKVAEQTEPAPSKSEPSPKLPIPEVHCLERSRLLTALVHLKAKQQGDVVQAWPINDPRLATYFFLDASNRGIPLPCLVDLILVEHRIPSLWMLILALDNYDTQELRLNARLDAWLRKAYLTHPSAAIHGAIRFLLRKLGHSEWMRKQDEAMRGTEVPGLEWYITKMGIPMVILPAFEDSPRLAISMEEITVDQFKSCFPDFVLPTDCTASTPDHPISYVTAIEALRYCERLSLQEGISPKENSVEFGAQPTEVSIDTTKVGYRLPTMREMQWASQAGAATTRFYGEEQTPQIERFVVASQGKEPSLVGSRFPNRNGLSDTLGNVAEWTLDLQANGVSKSFVGQSMKQCFDFSEAGALSTFGGSYFSSYPRCLPSKGGIMHPKEATAQIGFRIVCLAPGNSKSRAD